MRPISKGNWPTWGQYQINFDDYLDRNGKLIHRYGRAKRYLINRTGEYCHVCERRIAREEADVEHILPRAFYPAEIGNWDNFLLICQACNKSKSDNDPGQNYPLTHAFPHLENTFDFIEVNLASGHLRPVHGLIIADSDRANATINLYQLNKEKVVTTGAAYTPFQRRIEAIVSAVNLMVTNNCDLTTIVHDARRTGYLTVYLQVATICNRQDVISALLNDNDFHLYWRNPNTYP